jgi:hypothetical protein
MRPWMIVYGLQNYSRRSRECRIALGTRHLAFRRDTKLGELLFDAQYINDFYYKLKAVLCSKVFDQLLKTQSLPILNKAVTSN